MDYNGPDFVEQDSIEYNLPIRQISNKPYQIKNIFNEKFIGDDKTSYKIIANILKNYNDIAILDVYGTLINYNDAKFLTDEFGDDPRAAINKLIIRGYDFILTVDQYWTSRTFDLMNDLFDNYHGQIIVFTPENTARWMLQIVGNNFKTSGLKLDILHIITTLTNRQKNMKILLIDDNQRVINAWRSKNNNIDLIFVPDAFTIKYITSKQKSFINFIHGDNVTFDVLQKYWSNTRLLIGLDVHSTLLDRQETYILPEAKKSVNILLTKGYPIFIATNGKWSSNMEYHVRKVFADAPSILNNDVAIIVLDRYNRERLIKQLANLINLDIKTKLQEMYDKIDVINLLEYINDTAALVLFDNNEHNCNGWTKYGKLCIYVPNGITVKSTSKLPTKNDLDVTEKMAVHAYKQLQKAISNDGYYDYIHDKFYDNDNLDMFTRYQISVEKDIPVVGDLIKFYNIWLPIIMKYVDQANIETRLHEDVRFRVLLTQKITNSDRYKLYNMGEQNFLNDEYVLSIFKNRTIARSFVEQRYKQLAKDMQISLNKMYSPMDTNFMIEYDDNNMYLTITHFSDDLVVNNDHQYLYHLTLNSDKSYILPILWKDGQRYYLLYELAGGKIIKFRLKTIQ